MSNAKEASEAEALGTKVLNLCRKKASEKDLLTVLEVRVCDEILNSFSLSRERIQNVCFFLSSVYCCLGDQQTRFSIVRFIRFSIRECDTSIARHETYLVIISVL